ncbi:MAG: DVUA0089 family protein [Phycisphaerales bacterium]|nr:DVUA0089 family protein [Phycisphaerales bacterium]
MHRICAFAAIAAAAVSCSAFARSAIHLGANPIEVNGTILRVTPQLGGPDFDGASTVDRWTVTVDAAGVYFFNALSWELDWSTNTAVDVNGDGEIAFIDTYLRLFRDDGDLTPDDQVGKNDDRFFHAPADADGSIYGYDSYLSLFLAPGDYILAVGAYHMSIPDVMLGLDVDNNFYPVTWSDDLQEFLPSDHGDYRVTMGLVPAPGGAAVGVLSLLAALRRRR